MQICIDPTGSLWARRKTTKLAQSYVRLLHAICLCLSVTSATCPRPSLRQLHLTDPHRRQSLQLLVTLTENQRARPFVGHEQIEGECLVCSPLPPKALTFFHAPTKRLQSSTLESHNNHPIIRPTIATFCSRTSSSRYQLPSIIALSSRHSTPNQKARQVHTRSRQQAQAAASKLWLLLREALIRLPARVQSP